MIKISLRYPYSEKGRFDFDDFVNQHVPWARQLIGPALKGFEIEQGISGREPASNQNYIAIANLYFDTVDDFRSSYGPKAAEIQGDILNHTDIQPTLQISQVMASSVPGMT